MSRSSFLGVSRRGLQFKLDCGIPNQAGLLQRLQPLWPPWHSLSFCKSCFGRNQSLRFRHRPMSRRRPACHRYLPGRIAIAARNDRASAKAARRGLTHFLPLANPVPNKGRNHDDPPENPKLTPLFPALFFFPLDRSERFVFGFFAAEFNEQMISNRLHLLTKAIDVPDQ